MLVDFHCALFTNTVLADSEHAEKDHDEHHEEHADSVELNPEQLKTAGITLEQVQAAMMHERLPVYGSVALNSEKRSACRRVLKVWCAALIKSGR